MTWAFSAAELLGGRSPLGGREGLALAGALAVWLVGAVVARLYQRDTERIDHSTLDELPALLAVATIAAAWPLFLAEAFGISHPSAHDALVFCVAVAGLTMSGRATSRALLRRRRPYRQNALIVGAGTVGQLVARKFLQHPEYGVNLLGLVDEEPKERRDDLDELTLVGRPEELPALVERLAVDRIIIAFSKETPEAVLALIGRVRDLGVRIDIVPRLFEAIGPRVAYSEVEGLPLVSLPPLRLSRVGRAGKRATDIVLSVLALVLLAPLFAVMALLIKLDSTGPVFYRWECVGRDGRRFHLIKFRTMHLDYCRGEQYGGSTAEAAFNRLMEDPAFLAEFDRSHKLVDDPRVTRTGRWLRARSFDELPQLLNVLLGHLSLVGPRPISTAELEKLGAEPETLRYFKPGATGYWQVSGRSRTSFDERVVLDMAYVMSWSLRLDLQIIVKTLGVVVSRAGAY